MEKTKLKDRKVFTWLKEKFPDALGSGLEVIGDLTGRESLEVLGKLVKGRDDIPQQDIGSFNLKLEHEYNTLKLEVEDRNAARNREIEIAKTPKKDYMMGVTGIIGLALFVFLAVAIVFVPGINDNKLLIHLLGLVEGAVMSIFMYYFGSSKGSKDKTDLIGKS